MGGTVDVDSQLGQGATFTIRLPADVSGVVEAVASPEPPAATPMPADGNCILVIDDESASRDLISRALERDGHQVVQASGGEDGLRLARELQPLAITLDVLMPGKDGWQVLRELKADPVTKPIPVIMVSVVDGGEMGFALGATDFLLKPIDRDQLRSLLHSHGIDSAVGQVLVVDDDAEMRRLLRRSLEKEGYRVAEAAQGKEALELVADHKPDLILLDLMMPVMDGIEFLTHLRAREDWRDIAVIVVTAKDLTDTDRRLLSGKIEQVVEKKSSTSDDLSRIVRRLVRPAPGAKS
jgi:CheY-like chemotaxis protein